MLFGDLDTALRSLALPALLRPFIKAEIPLNVPLWRCDYLLGPDGWRLVEMNAGAAIGEMLVEDFNRCVRAEPMLAAFLDAHGLDADSPMDSLAEAVRDRCAALPIDEQPTVAVIDWEGFDVEYGWSGQRVTDYYRAHGLHAIQCHQRQVRYAKGRLWYRDEPVHAVHRAFILEDLAMDAESARPVLDAAADGNVVLVSSFRDEWLVNKATLAMFHDAAARGLLPQYTRAAVADVVPPTFLVTDETEGWYKYAVRSAQARERHDAASLVHKPAIGSASAGVVIGRQVDAESFWRSLDAASSSGAQVLQSFVAPHPQPFPWLDDGHLAVEPSQAHPGVFVLGGELRGVSVRMLRGTEPGRCSSLHGAYLGAVWY